MSQALIWAGVFVLIVGVIATAVVISVGVEWLMLKLVNEHRRKP